MCDKEMIHSMDDDNKGGDDDITTSVNGDDVVSVEKCVFRRGRCVTHNCDTRSFKVSVKKWQWIDRRKEYGFVSSKVTKYICLNLVNVKTAPGKASLSVEVGRLSDEKILSQQQRAVNNGTLGGRERESFVYSEPASMTGMCSEDYHNKT